MATVFVLHCTVGGVPYEPEVYGDMVLARNAWRAEINRLTGELFDYNGVSITKEDAERLVFVADCEGDRELRLYTRPLHMTEE